MARELEFMDAVAKAMVECRRLRVLYRPMNVRLGRHRPLAWYTVEPRTFHVGEELVAGGTTRQYAGFYATDEGDIRYFRLSEVVEAQLTEDTFKPVEGITQGSIVASGNRTLSEEELR